MSYQPLIERLGLKEKSPWTIQEAVALIAFLEPDLRRESNHFLGICGGVARSGKSEKDLDLIVIPMNGDTQPSVEKAILCISKKLENKDHILKLDVAAFNKQKFVPLDFYAANIGGKRVEFIFQNFRP